VSIKMTHAFKKQKTMKCNKSTSYCGFRYLDFTDEEYGLLQEYIRLDNKQFIVAQKFKESLQNRCAIFSNTTIKDLSNNNTLMKISKGIIDEMNSSVLKEIFGYEVKDNEYSNTEEFFKKLKLRAILNKELGAKFGWSEEDYKNNEQWIAEATKR